MEHRARDLVLEHGWNATAYQILNPGITRWYSEHGDAVVGYVRRSGVRVVAGSPVAAQQRLAEVAEEWRHHATRHGDRVCYFGAENRLIDALGTDSPKSTVLLGAQPVWAPLRWPDIVQNHPSLRAQLNRSRNKGVTVCEWSRERCTDHPGLHRCLEEWLDTRGLPPLHFLVEPETLGDPGDRRVFVAEMEGEPVGFVVMAPIPLREGWLTEQFVRGRKAPNGTIELLLDHAVDAVAGSDAQYVTMGLVPLADHGLSRTVDHPWWLRGLLPWVRAHGKRFYNFEGLDAFKTKFQPESWEPIYAVSYEPAFSPRTLYAITAAFTVSPPPVAIAQGLGRALRQEVRWLLHRRHW